MGKTSIEWAHYTFNIVWGCAKVSAECTNCYALSESKRRGFDNIWGTYRQGATRRTFGEHHWNDPRRWNRRAARDGVRARAFCSSMADVNDPHPETRAQLPRLYALIKDTPWLDWLLLTKRPEEWAITLPEDWSVANYPNVWLGTSAALQRFADERVPELLKYPAVVHFVSAEPLLESTSFHEWTRRDRARRALHTLDWIIVGGESGVKARPMHYEWVRRLRDECRASRVAFFFKQWGEWIPTASPRLRVTAGRRALLHDDGRSERRVDLARAFRADRGKHWWIVERLGKKHTGRAFDCVEYSQLPTPRVA